MMGRCVLDRSLLLLKLTLISWLGSNNKVVIRQTKNFNNLPGVVANSRTSWFTHSTDAE